MIDHLGVQVGDVEASLTFYLTAFAPLGLREAIRLEHPPSFVVGLAGPDEPPIFWLAAGPSGETREVHLALTAPDRTAVDAVHAAAVSAATRCCTPHESGRSTTPATTRPSCATRTGTTSRPSRTQFEAAGSRPG